MSEDTQTTEINQGENQEQAQQTEAVKGVGLTQEQLDKIIAREKRSGRQDGILEVLQIAELDNVDELRQIVAAHREAVEADMTEREKLEAALEKERAKRAQEQEQVIALQAERDELLIAQKIEYEAAKPDYGLTEDARKTLVKLLDRNLLSIKDGEIGNLGEAIKRTLEDNPILKNGSRRGDGLGSPTRKTPARLPEVEKRETTSRFPDLWRR